MSTVNELYCSVCGEQSIILKIPCGDTHQRKVCNQCETVHYENPKVVVGAVTTFEDKFLLCKRAIEPQVGLWTYPAGFLENGESLEDGAKREAFEEACAEIDLTHLIGTYSLLRVNQIHVIYGATLAESSFDVSHESSEVALFDKKDIPWDELAFPVIRWALRAYFEKQPGEVDSKASNRGLEKPWD